MSLSRRLRRQADRQVKNGSVNISQLIDDGKYRMTVTQFGKIVEKLNNKQKNVLFSNPLPKSYKEIRQIKTNYIGEFENTSINLQWYVKNIIAYSNYIKKFLTLKRSYERNLLIGNYDKALSDIEIINENVCYSQWAIEQILLINEYKNGLKGNKQALRNIEENSEDGVIHYLANLQSLRVEKSLPLFQYNLILSKSFENFEDLEKKYYSYKACFFAQSDFDWSVIMWADSIASIIDRYLLFQEATCVLTSSSRTSRKIIEDTVEAVEQITYLIDDNLLYNTLLCAKNKKENKTHTHQATNIYYRNYDLYTKGCFAEAAECCLDSIVSQPELIDLYELYIVSIINAKKEFINPFVEGSISHKILLTVYQIYSKGNNVEAALNDLLKICYSIGSGPISFILYAIFCRSNSIVENNINRNKLAVISSVKGNSFLGMFADNFQQTLEIIDNNPFTKSSITIQSLSNFVRRTHNMPVIYPDKTNNFFQYNTDIDIIMFKKEYKVALSMIDSILSDEKFLNQTTVKYNLENILHKKLTCYLKLLDFASAIELVTESNLKNPGFFSRFGYNIIMENALKAEDDKINSSISTPILLKLYGLRYQISTNSLWTAYDNYMFSIDIKVPSELREYVNTIHRDKLIYFLKNICVQEVLGLSYNDFENEDDLDNERMAVLALLCEIDYKNYEEYVEEIQILSSNVEIRKGIKQLDESKIYVDIVGIRNSLEKDLKESYNRSLELDSLNIPGLEKLLDRLGISVSVLKVDGETNKIKMITKSSHEIENESEIKYQSFEDSFLRVREMFVSNSDFGLDSYVSMRVRHGALLGQIRSIFESFDLITRRLGDTNVYMNNIYWTTRLEILDQSELDEINSLFAKFSSHVDQYSEDLKNKWLQLNTEEKPTDGLFNYVYSNRELSNLYETKFATIRSYDEFFDMAIEELWTRTEKNLRMLREYVLSETQNKIIEALDELGLSITTKLSNKDLTELIRSITECKTQFRYGMEKIADWFRRSNISAINDFKVDLPIKTSLTTVRKMHHHHINFTPEQNINSSIVFKGKYFTHFSDLFRNLFDNILTHSGLSEDELLVRLSVFEIDDYMNITIINNISPVIDLDWLNEKIHSIEQSLANPLEVDRTRSEGGTGYPKINKILRSDLGRKEYKVIINKIDKSRLFEVLVQFEIKGLQQQIYETSPY